MKITAASMAQIKVDKKYNFVAPALLLFTFALLGMTLINVSATLPAVDWYISFYPAIQNPFDPYTVPSYMNAPWIAILLSPLGWLPYAISQASVWLLITGVTVFFIFKRGGTISTVLWVITSAPFAYELFHGQIDWLLLIAFLIPPGWGMSLLLGKPQIVWVVGLLWIKQSQNKFRIILPTLLIGIFSFLIWGWWPPRLLANVLGIHPYSTLMNASAWPWLIPVGLFLLGMAWKQEDELIAMLAAICLTPYFSINALLPAFSLLAIRKPYMTILVWILLWAFIYFRY